MSRSTDRVYEGADILDSRDIIAKIEELESLLEDDPDDFNSDDDKREELKNLRALAEESSGSPDWPYGETLIADSYFEQYAQELAEDIGAVQKDATWPNQYIDWEAAADALKQDYMSVAYGETEYWIRA